jgi:hypothetical protein
VFSCAILLQARMAALKDSAASRKHHLQSGHGELREIVEDDFLKEVTSAKYVCSYHPIYVLQGKTSMCCCRLTLVHFYHPEFETCRVMDKHLRIIAAKPSAIACKFIKIDGTCPCK